MPNLFGLDIKSLVASTIGPGLVDAVLAKSTPGTYDINDPAAGSNPTSTTASCKVVQSEWLQQTLEDSIVRRVSGEVVVILGTIASGAVPAIGDTLTFVDPTGSSRAFTVTSKVDVDPAGATATCVVQG